METNERLSFDRQRTTGGVITDGYHLFFSNIWTVIKRLWILAAVYALACGLIGYHVCNNMLPKMMTPEGLQPNLSDMWTEVGILAAYELFFLMMVVLMLSQVINMFQEHRQHNSITCRSIWPPLLHQHINRRMVIIVGWMLLISVVASAVTKGAAWGMTAVTGTDSVMHSIPSLLVVALVALLLTVALLPFSYTLMKNAIEGPLSFKLPVKGYAKAFAHEGMLFAVLLTTAIISLIVTVLMEAPALYITQAHVEAQHSVALGDPNGLPSSIGVLTFLAFAFSGFFQAFIHTSVLFPFYYAYAKIEGEKGKSGNEG